jgi:hypothetical protein
VTSGVVRADRHLDCTFLGMRTCTLITVFCLVFSPIVASAQQNSPTATPPRLIISEKALADALAAEQPSMRDDRDSLKNGALIGAIIGGIAFGGFVGWLCNALQEPSDPSCVPPSLLYTGVGAGIGAAAGLGIDALFMRVRLAPPATPPAGRRLAPR